MAAAFGYTVVVFVVAVVVNFKPFQRKLSVGRFNDDDANDTNIANGNADDDDDVDNEVDEAQSDIVIKEQEEVSIMKIHTGTHKHSHLHLCMEFIQIYNLDVCVFIYICM